MATTYTRPSDWLTMPTVATSSQTFAGLFAVCNHDSNYVAVKATTNTGNYQVNWGDGTITTHASNTQAEYLYTYSAISDSTLCSRGYKQVIITVTPVTGNILTFITNVTHSAVGTGTKKVTWLDWIINFPYLSSGASLAFQGGIKHSWLEKMTISHIGGLTDMSLICSSMYGLKQLNITATTTGVTNCYIMCGSCYSLISVNLFNTSNVTNTTQMFWTCSSLEEIPNFNFSKVTSATGMFQNCSKLKTVPALDMRLNLDFSSMFSSCVNLTEIGLMDVRSGTNFNNFANGCFKLKTVENLNMGKATTATSAFASCYSLDNFPAMTVGTASCNLTSFLSTTGSLKTVGAMDVSKAVNFTSFLTGTPALRIYPAFNVNAGTTLTGMVGNMATKVPFTNVRASHSLANKNLGRTAIVEVFNGLASGVTSRTITISANPGFPSTINLNAATGNWRGLTVQSSSQDVYASNVTTKYVYKQTGGVGPFVVDSGSYNFLGGMGTDIYGNIYCARPGTGTYLKKTGGVGSWAVINTDVSGMGQMSGDFLGNLYFASNAGLYKQTAMTGSSVQVYSGVVATFTISPIDGSIYVTDSGGTGTIYKQTAGTGSFVAVQNLPWYGSLCCSTSGDVYVTNGSTLQKQTAGTGSFVSMGIATPGTFGGVLKSDGTLYTVATDIYLTDFSKVITPTDRLIATSKGWTIA